MRGVGPWTIEYIAMRALGWPDAFPAGDLVLLRALGETSRGACARAQRSVATVARVCRHAPVEIR